MPPLNGFSRINKIKEKIIYFYSLSEKYNNRPPAVAMIAKTAFIAIGGPP
jgi:hypothetical protein